MLAADLIDPPLALGEASAPRRAIARLQRGAVLPARLSAADPALARLAGASLDGLAETTTGDGPLIDALARCTDTPAGEHTVPAPSAERGRAPARLGTADAGAARRPDAGKPARTRSELPRVRPPARTPRGAASAARPTRDPAAAGARPPVVAPTVPERVLRVLGDPAVPGRGTGAGAPVAPLARFAASLPGGSDAAASAIVPGAAGDAPPSASGGASQGGAHDGTDPRSSAGREATPAGTAPPHGVDREPSAEVAGGLIPPASLRAGRDAAMPSSASLADDERAPAPSRPRDVSASRAAQPGWRPASPPEPGLAGLARWWDTSTGEGPRQRPASRPVDEPSMPEPLAASDLTTAMGRLFVAEARRYGIEVDET